MANLATINNNILADSGIDPLSLIVGTGTVNYVPKFTAEDTVANSQIFDNGTNVGIGTVLPNELLSLNATGNVNIHLTNATSGTTTNDGFKVGFNTSLNAYLLNKEAASILFYTSDTLRATLDASGNLGLGVTPDAWGSNYKAIQLSAAVPYITSYNQNLVIGANFYRNSAGAFIYTSSAAASNLTQNAGSFLFNSAISGTIGGTITFSELMRLNSSGNLSIGNTNNTYKLDVTGNIRSSETAIIGNGASQTELQINSLGGNNQGPFIRFQKAGAAKGYIGTYSAIISGTSDDLTYYATGSQQWMTNNSATIKMTLDASGNLGLGVTPAAWRNIFNAFQIGYTGVLYALTTSNATEQANLASNYYQDSAGNELRVQTGYSTRYQQANGQHVWSTAGTAAAGSGITYTQAMTLKATSQLQLNQYGSGTFTGTVAYNLAVDASGNIIETAGGVVDGSGTANYVPLWQDANTLTNSAIYQTGGNVGIGTTSPNYGGWGKATSMFSTASSAFEIATSRTTDATSIGGVDFIQTNNTTNKEVAQISAYNTGTTANNTGGYLTFWTKADAGSITERMRITSGGLVGIGTSAPGEKLEVSSSANSNVAIKISNSVTSGYIQQNATSGTGALEIASGGAYPLVLGTNGTERMRITSGGDVGIGTSSPQTKLHVSGDITLNTTLLFNGTNLYPRLSRSTNDLYFSTNGAGEVMRITDAGNVGVGTSSPNYKLSVNGSANLIGTATSSVTLGFGTDNGVSGWSIGNGIIDNTHNFRIYDNTNGVVRLTINNSGYVGIGTTSPATPLDIVHASGNGLKITSNDATAANNAGFFFSNTASATAASRKSVIVMDPNGGNATGIDYFYITSQGDGRTDIWNAKSDGYITLGTNDTERMRITSGGNVGIGTTSPGYKLDINPSTYNRIASYFSGTYISGFKFSDLNGSIYYDAAADMLTLGSDYVNGKINFTTAGTERMRITSGGNVGIGNSSPIAQLGITATGYTASLSLSGNSKTFNKAINGLADGQGGTPQYYHFATYTIGGGYYTEVVKGTITCGRSYQANNLSVNIEFTISVVSGVLNAVYLQTEWKYFSGNFYVIDAGSGVYKFVVYNDFANQTGLTYDLEYYAEGGTGGVGSVFSPIAVVTTTTIPSGTQVTQYKNSYIKSSGNVGIGTTSPSGQLDVYATGTDLQTYFSQASSGNNNFTRWTRASGPTLIAGVVRSTNDGNQKANTAFIGTSNAYDFLLYSSDLERMRITSGGDININMPNSTNRYLSWYSANGVYQVAAVSSITDPSYNDAGYLIFSTARTSSGGFTEKMRITPNGNVGIGTTNPGGARLNVQSTSTYMHIGNTDDTRYMDMGMWVANRAQIEVGNGDFFIKTQQSNDLFFGTNSAERMRITSGGNVYIGSTSGDYGKLDVTVSPSSYTAALGLGIQTNSGEGNSVGISFKTKISLSGAIWENARIAVFTDGITSSAYGAMAFYTMNATTLSERMRIGNNGYVGIGTSSPSSFFEVAAGTNGNFATPAARISTSTGGAGGATILQINHTANSVSGLQIAQYGATPGNYTSIVNTENSYMMFGTNNTERMRITSAGEVWMGYTADQGAYLLQVNGTIYASGDVIAYSDISVKNNIRPIDNVLSRISNSRGVLYDRTDKDEKDNIGFIAQELEQQFPELVSTNKDGTKGVKYQNAVAVLFEAIKEQQKQIDQLKNKN